MYRRLALGLLASFCILQLQHRDALASDKAVEVDKFNHARKTKVKLSYMHL